MSRADRWLLAAGVATLATLATVVLLITRPPDLPRTGDPGAWWSCTDAAVTLEPTPPECLTEGDTTP